ncbi:MAG: transposase [Gammaproteobacteria bacterium]|nr:transposase [Gammaproteobacteria bacterium]
MKTWNGGGGFSVNGTARIHENDREGLERLLRYCARPPFALERIKQQPDGSLIYQLNKPLANGQTQLKLTSMELIDKLAALVPLPRIHHHRYYGVLASNSPFRASVTAMAGLSLHGTIEVQNSDHKDDEEPIELDQENKPKRRPNRYLWAKLPYPAHAPYLHHVGKVTESPSLSSARGPPCWDDYNEDSPVDENGLFPEYEFDQCVSW